MVEAIESHVLDQASITGTYTLKPGVGLQVNTDLDGTDGLGGGVGTGVTTIQLDGGSIAGYMYDDEESYATFRNITSDVTIRPARVLQKVAMRMGRKTSVGSAAPSWAR